MLHTLFQNITAIYPNELAVSDEYGKSLAYKDLEIFSNRVANALLAQGVQCGDPVIVRLERSSDQVAILLALSKIGAIYVPVSLNQCDSHLAHVISDCKATYLIMGSAQTTCSILSQMPLKQIRLSELKLHNFGEKLPELNLHDRLIAYIAYSSGTTGLPKGIPIIHAGMNYWYRVLKRTVHHAVLHKLAYIAIDFDAHIWEYLIAWTFGAALHIASESTRNNLEELVSFITKRKITDATLTPAVLRVFKDHHIDEFQKSGLKAIYSTGEACTSDIVEKYRNFFLFNCYGPTEATFGISMVRVTLEKFHEGMAPVAFPDEEIRVKLIDLEGNTIVSPQTEGELVIISPYLTPGYLNLQTDKFREEKTEQGSIRSYRTGDKFIQQGGWLYYKGRNSDLSHVKIRGQLVNIIGVENILRAHPKIKDVCVIVREDILSAPVLVAFLVSDEPPTRTQLHAYCLSRLFRQACVPTFFVVIDKMPLKLTGKIDREILRERPFLFQRDASLAYLAPKTLLESRLIILWHEILTIRTKCNLQIGVSDNFIALGGDSITAMQLLNKINSEFGIDLSFTCFGPLDQLTVATLAEKIYLLKSAQMANACVKLLRAGSVTHPPIFFIHPITGEGVWSYVPIATALTTKRPLYAVDAPGLINPLLTSYSMTIIAHSYLTLIKKLQPHGPYTLIGWSAGSIIAYHIAALLEGLSEEVDQLIILDQPAPSMTKLVSDKMFSEQLIELIAQLSKQQPISCQVTKQDLFQYPKEQQIKYLFEHTHSDEPKIKKELQIVKAFLYALLIYEVPYLKTTALSLFFSEKTFQQYKKFFDTKNYKKTLGWARYNKTLTCFVMPGDHFSILQNHDEVLKLSEKIAGLLLSTAIPMWVQGFFKNIGQFARVKRYKIAPSITKLQPKKSSTLFAMPNKCNRSKAHFNFVSPLLRSKL